METNLDLLRVDAKPPRGLSQTNTLYFSTVLLVIAIVMAFGVRLNHSDAAASTAGAVAYCVTTDDSPAQAGLTTGLYTVGADQLSRYSVGVTDHNGCGVFNYVPVDTLFFVSAWSVDGQQVGNGAWFESDAMTIAPTVQLDTPGFYNRLAFH
jgi:hypothetical protein